MVRTTRPVRLAAAVTLILAASTSLGADRSPANPSPRTQQNPPKRESAHPAPGPKLKKTEARLDAVKIVGSAEQPAILFFLPRAKFRLLPLRPESDRESRFLRDDKHSGEPPGW